MYSLSFEQKMEKYANCINALLGDELSARVKAGTNIIGIVSKKGSKKYCVRYKSNEDIEVIQEIETSEETAPLNLTISAYYHDVTRNLLYHYANLLNLLHKYYSDEPCTILELVKTMKDDAIRSQKVAKLKDLVDKLDNESAKYTTSSDFFASIKKKALDTEIYKAKLCLEWFVSGMDRTLKPVQLFSNTNDYETWLKDCYLKDVMERLSKQENLAQTELTVESDTLYSWLSTWDLMIYGRLSTKSDSFSFPRLQK